MRKLMVMVAMLALMLVMALPAYAAKVQAPSRNPAGGD
jgi:Tfp pilus assembly protein PilE